MEVLKLNKDELIDHRDRTREHLVVWIVLTICLQILTFFHVLAFLKYVVWLSAAYSILLIILWCYLEFKILRKKWFPSYESHCAIINLVVPEWESI